ncbi:hypothetical protein [Zooshikella harenae]|uniref:Uncharacterized protein n=1 Tax=Zooshikella harenae TaxID=2827238 RepID=A0ABS5ZB01_9GAMM|nr:hypothetical protein [Zooshikella harenae]MBU2711234.1 hypothetical protein [Zooshikella harenae]
MNKVTLFTLTWMCVCTVTAVYAVPPHYPDLTKGGNRWLVTFYNDTSPSHDQWATQGICFYPTGNVGTHQQYVWVSDTYPDWNGRATQEGDQVFMHGDFQWYYNIPYAGHDALQWQIVTGKRTIGSGHWQEWLTDEKFGRTFGWGNALWRRVGKCEIDNADEALEKYRDLPRDGNSTPSRALTKGEV